MTVTDDMIMLQKTHQPEYSNIVQNAVRAINAGNNLLLYVNNYNLQQEPERNININNLVIGIEQAVKDGKIKESTIDADVAKDLTLRQQIIQLK